MSTQYSITEYFSANLAKLLSEKILTIYPAFNSKHFIRDIDQLVGGKHIRKELSSFAEQLNNYLPSDYAEA